MRYLELINIKNGRLIKLLFLLIIVLSFSGCSAVNNGPIRIGMVDDHAPWEKKISETDAQGISVDLLKAFSKHTGYGYKIIWLKQDDLYKALSDKRIDCILSSAPISDANSETYLMSDPYTKSYPILLIRNSSPVYSKVQLNRETTKIAVIANTQNETFVKSEYSNAVIQTYLTRTEAVNALNDGFCDVFIDDPLSVFTLFNTNLETTRLNPAPLTDKFQYYTVYVSPDQENLVAQWNEFFTYARKNKIFDDIIEKHISPFKPIMDKHNITITL